MDYKSVWGFCELWTRRFPVNLNRVMLHFDDQVKKKKQKQKKNNHLASDSNPKLLVAFIQTKTEKHN